MLLELRAWRGKGMQRGSNRTIVPYETSIKVSKAQKPLQLLVIPGYRPISHSTDLRWIHLDTSGVHNEPQDAHTLLMEFALLRLNKKLFSSSLCKT